MQIPSLQYLCLRKINEENPIGFKKFVAKNDYIFEDLANVVEKERKMIDKLIKRITMYGGIVYGGAQRDLINNEVPRNLDVWFERKTNLNWFLGLYNNFIILSEETKGLDLITKYYDTQLLHMKILFTKTINETPINIFVNIISEIEYVSWTPFSFLNDGGLDIDVNTFMIDCKPDGTQSFHSRIKLALSDAEIQKQIYRKEYKVFCRTDCFVDPEVKVTQDCIWKHNKQIKATMKKLNARGWTCINGSCQFEDCLFYN
jgi:hypothetical protein